MQESMANPTPNKATRFQKGESGNPKGKTSEQKTQELKNAEAAVALRGKMLEALGEVMEGMTPEQMLERLDPNTLKLFKDAEDRGLGAPVQPITSPDGSLRPSVIELVGVPIPDDQSTD